MAAIDGRYRSGSHFFMQATMPVSLAHTASRIYSLFISSTNHSAHPRLRLFTYTGLYLQSADNLRGRISGYA